MIAVKLPEEFCIRSRFKADWRQPPTCFFVFLLVFLLLPLTQCASPTFAPSQLRSTNNMITNVAGTGSPGYSGMGGMATAAAITYPRAVFKDSSGYVYFSDGSSNCVQKFWTRDNLIFPAAGTCGSSGNYGDGGPATVALISSPIDISVDTLGSMYICDYSNNRIRSVRSDGTIITYALAGSGNAGNGGQATSARFSGPQGLGFSSAGSLYITSDTFPIVRVVTSDGIINAFAGSGTASYGGDGLTATAASFFGLEHVMQDTALVVYISDAKANRLRIVSNDGIVSTVFGSGTSAWTEGVTNTAQGFSYNVGIGVDANNGDIYISARSSNLVAVASRTTGLSSSVAGTAGAAGSTGDDGPATSAYLSSPDGINLESWNRLYFCDRSNRRVRLVYSLNPTASPTAVPTAPTLKPSATPSLVPSQAPTVEPTLTPSQTPSVLPSVSPSAMPSVVPTAMPSVLPSFLPSAKPTVIPTVIPTIGPTQMPTFLPTTCPSVMPTQLPTIVPTVAPSQLPTDVPSRAPTLVPSSSPSNGPTVTPTVGPTVKPSVIPTLTPSVVPTVVPTTTTPTVIPTVQPSIVPSVVPTVSPSVVPTQMPSRVPTQTPTAVPTLGPTVLPSQAPTLIPTVIPSVAPSMSPSVLPTLSPTTAPSLSPSQAPSVVPTEVPTIVPTVQPSLEPTVIPTVQPSVVPSLAPTIAPSEVPTVLPSVSPTVTPSVEPSMSPTERPSANPSVDPTILPSVVPTVVPSVEPTVAPSSSPSLVPTLLPTVIPSVVPTVVPSINPTVEPTLRPTLTPTIQPSLTPSMMPTVVPTVVPSEKPSIAPSIQPSTVPSDSPTQVPSVTPTVGPSAAPTQEPSHIPSVGPTTNPSVVPSWVPTQVPTVHPSAMPTQRPTVRPSVGSTTQKATLPSNRTISVLALMQPFRVVLPLGTTLSGFTGGGTFSDITLSGGVAGASYVVLGNKTRAGTTEIVLHDGQIGSFLKTCTSDTAKRSVSPLKDVNGDGIDDLIIGDPFASRCYVLFGNAGGYVNMSDGFTIFGEQASDLTGWSVSGAGDVNNDTIADIIIGAPNARGVGAFYVIFGRRNVQWFDVYAGNMTASDGFAVYGMQKSDYLGVSVNSAGDVNKDGCSDIIAGALLTSNLISGFAVVLFGCQQSIPMSIAGVSDDQGFKMVGAPFSYTGAFVSGAGDVNGDGYDDVLVSSSVLKSIVSVASCYLIYGNVVASVSPILLSTMVPRVGFRISGGGSIPSFVGDVNGDGFSDVLLTNADGVETKGGLIVYSDLTSFNLVTAAPSIRPTVAPTTERPTYAITRAPTSTRTPTAPTVSPTEGAAVPTESPTMIPTQPTVKPSMEPSVEPSVRPSVSATLMPSAMPTVVTTGHPSTLAPTKLVSSRAPVFSPTLRPTVTQTTSPTAAPVRVHYINDPNVVYNFTNANVQLVVNTSGSVSVVGSGGRRVYVLFPADNSTLSIAQFNQSGDVIDLRAFKYITEFKQLKLSEGSVLVTLSLTQFVHILNLHVVDVSKANFVFYQPESIADLTPTQVVIIKVISGVAAGVVCLIAVFMLRRGVLKIKKQYEIAPQSRLYLIIRTTVDGRVLDNWGVAQELEPLEGSSGSLLHQPDGTIIGSRDAVDISSGYHTGSVPSSSEVQESSQWSHTKASISAIEEENHKETPVAIGDWSQLHQESVQAVEGNDIDNDNNTNNNGIKEERASLDRVEESGEDSDVESWYESDWTISEVDEDDSKGYTAGGGGGAVKPPKQMIFYENAEFLTLQPLLGVVSVEMPLSIYRSPDLSDFNNPEVSHGTKSDEDSDGGSAFDDDSDSDLDEIASVQSSSDQTIVFRVVHNGENHAQNEKVDGEDEDEDEDLNSIEEDLEES